MDDKARDIITRIRYRKGCMMSAWEIQPSPNIDRDSACLSFSTKKLYKSGE